MYDVLLVQPPNLFYEKTNIQGSVPTHLLLLGTLLQDAGFTVKILPVAFDSIAITGNSDAALSFYYKEMVKLFKKYESAQFIGISCYVSSYYLSSVLMAWAVREALPDATIIIGGYGPSTSLDDFVYQDSPFDYVFTGEADLELPKLLVKLKNSPAKERQPGRNHKAGVIISEYIPDLSRLPKIDWTLLDGTPYAGFTFLSIPYYTSRGCPFHCRFCCDFTDLSEFGYTKKWRPRVISHITDELNSLHRYLKNKPANILFTDPIFGLKRKWKIELLESLIDLTRDWKNRYFCVEERVDSLNEKDIRLYSEMNICATFGFESGSPAILKLMNKTMKPDLYLKKMMLNRDLLEEHRIYYVVNIIFGFPGETKETLKESQTYISELFRNTKYGVPNAAKFVLFPGSYVSRNSKHEDYRHVNMEIPDWYKRNSMHTYLQLLIEPSSDLGLTELLDTIADWAKPFFDHVQKNFTFIPSRRFLYQQLKSYLQSNALIGDPDKIKTIKELAWDIKKNAPDYLPVDKRIFKIINL